MAGLVTDEHGKTVEDARGEVIRGREVIEFACGIPQLLKGDYSDQVSTGVDSYAFRQPLGVCAGITPFNFPVMVPMWMHPVAIACGNTFILKPSERDPSAANLVADLYAEAGLPAGVFNVVHGDRVAADALVEHPGIAAVSFVGSTPVARHIHQRASATGKRVQALGGAKNHAVVLPDADIRDAARQITAAAYGSAGQRCMAISAVVAVGAAGDALVPLLAEQARALRVGDGRSPGTDVGPVVTAAARDRVRVATLPDWPSVPTPVGKVLIACATPAGADDLAAAVTGAALPVTLIASENTYVELLPVNSDKGDALRWLAPYRRVPLAGVAAIGDNPNDIPMLRAAGLGVAVGDGHPAVRAAAGLIVGPCAGGAVADLVEYGDRAMI